MLRQRNIKLYQNQKQNHYLLIRKEVILKMMMKMIMMMIIMMTNFLTFLMLRQWYVEYVALNGNCSPYLVRLYLIFLMLPAQILEMDLSPMDQDPNARREGKSSNSR